MRLTTILLSAALALPVLSAGCGGVETLFGDGGGGAKDGGADGASGDMAVTPFKLDPGMYKVTALTDKMDGCMIDSDPMDPILGAKAELKNDLKANIEIVGWGAGQVLFNKGKLVKVGKYDSMTGCKFDYDVTLDVEVTSDNKLTAKYVEKDTNILAACMPNVGVMCTTTWTMKWEKQ